MRNLEPQDLTATPVDIETFLTSPDYLGDLFKDLYPYWLDVLKEIYFDPLRSKYAEVVLAGCIGAGRSFASLAGFLYDLYILTLVKDPHSQWTLIPTTPIDMAISVDVAGNYYEEVVLDALSCSPYFRSILLPGKGKVLEEGMFPNNVGIITGSTRSFYLGRAIVGALFECDGENNSDDSDIAHNYEYCRRRMFARFMGDDGIVPCRMWTVSSAPGLLTTFLKNHIDYMRTALHTWVIEPAIWDVNSHKGIYCGDSFLVYAGDGDEKPRLLNEGEIGYSNYPGKVIKVPVEYRQDFEKDIYMALVELAGIPVPLAIPEQPECEIHKETYNIFAFFDKKALRLLLVFTGFFVMFILGVLYGMLGI